MLDILKYSESKVKRLELRSSRSKCKCENPEAEKNRKHQLYMKDNTKSSAMDYRIFEFYNQNWRNPAG